MALKRIKELNKGACLSANSRRLAPECGGLLCLHLPLALCRVPGSMDEDRGEGGPLSQHGRQARPAQRRSDPCAHKWARGEAQGLSGGRRTTEAGRARREAPEDGRRVVRVCGLSHQERRHGLHQGGRRPAHPDGRALDPREDHHAHLSRVSALPCSVWCRVGVVSVSTSLLPALRSGA